MRLCSARGKKGAKIGLVTMGVAVDDFLCNVV